MNPKFSFCLYALNAVIMLALAQGTRVYTKQSSLSNAVAEGETQYIATDSSQSSISLGNNLVNTGASSNDTGFKKELEETYDELPQWAEIILVILAILTGLLLTFVGALLYGILDSTIDDATENKAAICWGSSFTFGILVGLLLLKLRRVGVFFLGASAGVMLAMFLNPICLHLIWPEEPVINLYIWMGVFGIIFGLITLCLERELMILSTAFAGSFLIVLGIGAFAGNFPSYDQVTTEIISEYPWQWWTYLGAWALIFMIGAIVQFTKTAKHQDHKTEDHYHRL